MEHSNFWGPDGCLVTIPYSHWSIMSSIIGPFYTNRDFFFLFIAAWREGTWRIDLQLLNGIPFTQSLIDLGDHVPSITPDDFWSHLFTHSDQIISLLDTKSQWDLLEPRWVIALLVYLLGRPVVQSITSGSEKPRAAHCWVWAAPGIAVGASTFTAWLRELSPPMYLPNLTGLKCFALVV